MKLEILNTSVVVRVEGHNPAILHPAFLAAQKIVPEGWKAEEEPISTPAVSIVKYDNGMVFTVDPGKFQLVHNRPGADLQESQVPAIAYSYIEKLPHVHYTAVGINFTGFIKCEAPGAMLIEQFLTAGSWNSGDLKPEALGLQLVYDFEGGKLRVSCNSGQLKREQDEAQSAGIILDCNYHTELSAADYLKNAKDTIFQFPERYEHYLGLAKRVFDLEE